MRTSKRTIEGVSGSDFHLGANSVPTEQIVDGLNRLITNRPLFKDIDLAIFAGDVFDRLLPHPSMEAIRSREWMDDTTKLAAEENVILGILEGTPMHDWRQSRYFLETNVAMGNIADIRYADVVRVEYIAPLGIHVLWVPDEAHPNCALTKIAVEKALLEAGVTEVDITVLHGQFRHQFPSHLHDTGIDFHDTEFYDRITRHFVFIGHIHHHSIYKKFVSHGSIERLHHGYESPKGVVRFTLDLDNPKKSKCWFVENTSAKIFKTIKITGEDLNYEADNVRIAVANLPLGSAVRLEAMAEHPIHNLLSGFKREFPHFSWSSKYSKVKKIEKTRDLTERARRQRISIRRENLKALIEPKLDVHSPDLKQCVLKILEKCL